ncbi:adhesion G protein-coupled receptor E5-like [Bolinopsis microptera]|uniref:adhesion G protein-coupled receptor E5-like n=1 Tax=Bolinopsis microptera TaxID=2820187 RepID=UPI00307A84C4
MDRAQNVYHVTVHNLSTHQTEVVQSVTPVIMDMLKLRIRPALLVLQERKPIMMGRHVMSVALETTLMKLMRNAGTVRVTSTRYLVLVNVTSVKLDMKSLMIKVGVVRVLQDNTTTSLKKVDVNHVKVMSLQPTFTVKLNATLLSIIIETEESIEQLRNETMKTEEVSPRDIETVIKKMTDEKVETVFSSVTDTTDVFLVQNAADANTTIGDSNIRITVNQNSNIKNLAALIYKDNTAFQPPPNPTRGSSTIAGKVVGLQHTKRATNSTDISFRMKFDFVDIRKPEKKLRQRVIKECRYYETTSNKWSPTGCTTRVTEDGSVEYECDHMTSFAVIMTLTNKSSVAEDGVSRTLLGLSLSCLLLAVSAILPNKAILSMFPNWIHLMLMLSLIPSIICFLLIDIVADTEGNPSTSCSTIAFLLNYFWLCQLNWMVIEAVTLYKAVVQVFNTYIRAAKLKYCIIGWGLPLIFPILGFVWGGKQFVNPETCFVRKSFGLVTFYAPMAFGIMVNWILFFFIIRAVFKATTARAEQTEMTKVKMRVRQLRSALFVTTLLGLGWIVGFFLLVDSTDSDLSQIIRWTFILVNTPQGVFIFIFHVLLKEDVKTFWVHVYKLMVRESRAWSFDRLQSDERDNKNQPADETDQTSENEC